MVVEGNDAEHVGFDDSGLDRVAADEIYGTQALLPGPIHQPQRSSPRR